MPTECPAQMVIAVVTSHIKNPAQLGVSVTAAIPPAHMAKSHIDLGASQRMVPCTALVWGVGETRSVAKRWILRLRNIGTIIILDI